MENLKQASGEFSAQKRPQKYVSKILWCVALVNSSFCFCFFQNDPFTELIQNYILLQTPQFFTRLSNTLQDGFQNREEFCSSTGFNFKICLWARNVFWSFEKRNPGL